jgi:hypothetical protein
MAHNLGLVIAKAIQGQLAAGVPPVEIVRQAALFGVRNRDGWGTGMTILTTVGNALAALPEQETYLALFHGIRRVAIDCEGEAPARQRSSLSSRPSPATLKRWLRRWASVRHREAAERTVLTAIATSAPPAVLAELLISAETDRVFADGGHSFDLINKSFECLDLIGWQHAADLLPSVVGQMVAARGADESTEWRQPIDIVVLCANASADLAAALAAGRERGPWLEHTKLTQNLLGDDPDSIIAALLAAASEGEQGRPAVPTRFMVGLLLLKQIHGLSDELVCERWIYDPYFQFFTGAEFFAHEFPHERSGISHWRKRIGEKLDALLAETLRVAHVTGALKPRDMARVTVDSTVPMPS